MAKRFALFSVLLVEMLSVCASAKEPFPFQEIRWTSPPVRVDLKQWGDTLWEVEFSQDGKLLCAYAWDWAEKHDRPLRLVFDTQGRPAEGMVDERGALTVSAARLFSQSVPRSTRGFLLAMGVMSDAKVGAIRRTTPFPLFSEGADFWGCSEDLTLGVRIMNGIVQLWHLQPKEEQIWSVDSYKALFHNCEEASIFEREGKGYVLLALFGERGAYVFARDNGTVVDTLQYGHIETSEEAKAYGKRVNTPPYSSATFSAYNMSFDPKRRLLACGASPYAGRRVRIVSVDPPHTVVFEANTWDKQYLRGIGGWTVRDVQFCGDGAYLLVRYSCTGLYTLHPGYYIVEIFETATWKKIFSVNAEEMAYAGMSISPDGKKIALIREHRILEIGDFSTCSVVDKGAPKPKPTPDAGKARNRPKGKSFSQDLGKDIRLEMVWIKGGGFTMGTTQSDEEIERLQGWVDESIFTERPAHKVELDSYWLGKHEVTVAQFRRFVEETSYTTTAEKAGGSETLDKIGILENRQEGLRWSAPGFPQEENHPVVHVSWEDAVAFCQWLAKKTGEPYTLPTEAQWEYACRGGRRTLFIWGDSLKDGQGWLNTADKTFAGKYPDAPDILDSWDDGYLYTAPVGSFRPNAFGLYDMVGNVWECCLDGAEQREFFSYLKKMSRKNPVGPIGKDNCIMRGGSWVRANVLRPAQRGVAKLDDSNCGAGFRVCLRSK